MHKDMSVLVWRPCGALIYVYRPAALMRYLSDPRAAAALATEGYDVGNLSASLAEWLELAVALGYDGKQTRATRFDMRVAGLFVLVCVGTGIGKE